MENCKYCQSPLEEGNSVCPACGKDNEEAVPAVEAAEVTAEETVNQVIEETAEAAEQDSGEAAAEETIPEAEEAAETAEEKSEAPEAKKGILMTPGMAAAAVAVVILLIAVLIAVILSGRSKEVPAEETVADETVSDVIIEEAEETVPPDGNPDDVTCKGSYTASDEDVLAQSDVVVARAGDRELTNRQLQVFYWLEVRQFLSNYGYYAAYLGLDQNQSLDTQACGVAEGMTWQQYFLSEALQTWLNYQAMSCEAEANNAEMDPEHQQILASITDEMTQNAVENGFADADALVRRSLGAGADMDAYLNFLTLYYKGYGYFAQVENSIEIKEEETEAFFEAHADEYAENGISKDTVVVDVRHILIYPEGATAETARTETFSDEAWAAGEVNAQAVLDQWLAGDRTEESFAALANEKSGDPGSNTNGGLYTGVEQGQMVPAFDEWCFDPARQVGDTGIVKTEFGFHVMYFSGSHSVWQEYAAEDLKTERSETLLEESVAKYPMTADYAAIKLAYVDLNA